MKWISQSGFCRCVLVQSTKLNIHDLFLIKLIATAKQMRLGILCLPACRRPGSGYHDPWRWGGVWRGCSAGGTRHPAFGCRGRCPACGQSSPPTAHHVHHPPAQLLPPQRVSLHTEIRLSTGLTVLKKPGLRIRSGEVHKIFPDPKPRSDLW